MKSKVLSILFVLAAFIMNAQQNIGFNQGALVSPQVNADNSITFRLQSAKAKKVTVIGDWAANSGKGEMKKGKDGVWEYTTPVLPSEMYTYRFDIDGIVNLDPVNPFTRRDVGNVFSIVYVGNGCADYYQVKDVAHGDLVTTWYHSNARNCDRRMSVYLPPHYGKENKSYPVLYLIHGSGGDENAWVELGNTVRIMDNLIAEGKAEPMIVVMPNANFDKQAAPSETSENQDYKPIMTNKMPSYKNGDFELAFPEIVNFTDAKFRTIPDKAHRAVAGLSMGGFNTLYISLNYPTYFDYVGLFSAGLRTTDFDATRPVFSNIDGKIDNLKSVGYKLFWIGIGDDDPLLVFNKDFMSKLDSHNFKYEYHESTRGHIWANWRQYLLEFAPKLFK